MKLKEFFLLTRAFGMAHIRRNYEMPERVNFKDYDNTEVEDKGWFVWLSKGVWSIELEKPFIENMKQLVNDLNEAIKYLEESKLK